MTLCFETSDQIQRCDTHSQGEPVIAAGLVTGQVEICRYTDNQTEKSPFTALPKAHKRACRDVRFSHSGDQLLTVGADKCIHLYDTMTQQLTTRWRRVHDDAIGTALWLDENIFATGDESGVLHVFDQRSVSKIHSFHEHDDHITDLLYVSHKKTLFSTGGDGYLSVYDMKQRKLWARSDPFEEELSAVCVVQVRDKPRVVCAGQDGVLHLFKWGWWGDVKDRIVACMGDLENEMSLDSVIQVAPQQICVGGGDGVIRLMNIHPNKMEKRVGQHKDGMPVECMRRAFMHEPVSFEKPCRSMITSGHESLVYVWSLEETEDSGSDEEQEQELTIQQKKKQRKTVKRPDEKRAEIQAFFADL